MDPNKQLEFADALNAMYGAKTVAEQAEWALVASERMGAMTVDGKPPPDPKDQAFSPEFYQRLQPDALAASVIGGLAFVLASHFPR